MKYLLIIVLTTFFAASPIPTESFNTAESKVTFTVNNMKVRTVFGTFTGVKGTGKFDKARLEESYFDVSVDISTVDTDDKKRDEHLQEADFFDTAKYPTMKFVSKKIVKADEAYVVTGELTIRDVTKTVDISFTANEHDEGTLLKGGLSIKRKDYNVGNDYGAFMIGEQIAVEISCVLG